MNRTKTILMLISGISIGAILGVLFAPGSGTVTRRKLSNKGNDYLQNLGMGHNSNRSNVKHKIDHAKKELNSLPYSTTDKRQV